MAEKSESPALGFEPAEARRSSRLSARVRAFFLDKLGNVSRPKLLLAVALADIASAVFAWPIANILLGEHTAMSWSNTAVAAFVGLITVAIMRNRWSYSISSLRKLPSQFLKIMISVAVVGLGLAGLAFFLNRRELEPRTLICWMGLLAVFLCLVRAVASIAIERLTRAGLLLRRTVIVGGGKDAENLIRELQADHKSHIQILGIFDDRQGERAVGNYGGIARLGTFQMLCEFCRDSGVDLLIVTVPQRAEERLMQILEKLFTLEVDVRISALSSKLRLNSRAYSFIGNVPMLAVMDKPLNDWDRALKNVEDRVLGSILLLAALPLMAVVALAVRLDSKGPIFFRQKRYGFNNELIEVFKFRSLHVAGEDATGNESVTRNDSRVTRVGRFIRRTSLDELPQLINVVKGDMSLVGPRPHATGSKAEMDLFEHVVDGYFARHKVRPGITGWAQINGWRGGAETREKITRRVEYDLYYIDNWSISFDLYILVMTPISLATGKNAY